MAKKQPEFKPDAKLISLLIVGVAIFVAIMWYMS